MFLRLYKKIANKVVLFVAKINWKQKELLSQDELNQLYQLLVKDYYIILTRRDNQLGTFFINLGHFLLTGRWGYYSHVLMNLENEVHDIDDFRLIEATTRKGTIYTPFNLVFKDVDSVALLKPKNITIEEYTAVMDKARQQLGKPYDTLFDIANEQKLSCVELVRLALKALPDYFSKFANFEHTIAHKKNLTPQMFYECKDFEVVLKIDKNK